MATVHVPANIKTLQDSLKAKLQNPDAGKPTPPDPDRDRKRRMKEMKEKQREAEQSREQLAEQLASIQAELEEAKAARVAAEQKATELEPKAKNWSDYEHKERQVLLSKLPAEFKKEAGDMDMKHLKLFVSTVSGGGGKTQAGETFDRSKMTDDDMAKLAETNPAKFLELIEKK
jgi:DNA repair exonuclease SbcCD ATPase subunit